MKGAFGKSRRWKRWMALVVTALPAMVTTVAVSWGCALWVDPSGLAHVAGVGMSDPDPAADATYNEWLVQKYAAPGGTIVVSTWLDEDVIGVDRAATLSISGRPVIAPESVLPRWWGEALRPTPTGTTGRWHSRYGDAWGWPFNAMWTRWRCVDTTLSVRVYECERCLRLRNRLISTYSPWNHDRALPLAIIWQGFALNTLVYWGAWLALYGVCVVGVGGIRRSLRRRRGRCSQCGYDLRGSAGERCPECGHKL